MAIVVLYHTSRVARGAVLLTAVGFILLCISVATPYWRSSKTRHDGLWDLCQNGSCARLYSPETLKARIADGVDGWFQAVQVLEIVGMILSFGAFVIGFLYACVPPVSSRTSATWSVVTSFISGVCVLVGAIIYSQKTNNIHNLDLSWSFGLNLASCAVLVLGGILLLVAVRQQRRAEEL